MKIFIAGGQGQVGVPLGTRLRAEGHDVVVGSRRQRVDVVVDVLNTTDLDTEAATAFFRGSTERLFAAETGSGVRHHVLLSIVGADRALANGYHAGEVAQEVALRDGDVPFSIVRATQFYEFVPTIADWLTVEGVVHAARTLLQPLALADVVDLLARTALGGPTGSTTDLAGPRAFPLDDLLRSALADDPREVRTVDGQALGAEAVDALVPLGAHLTGEHPFPR